MYVYVCSHIGQSVRWLARPSTRLPASPLTRPRPVLPYIQPSARRYGHRPSIDPPAHRSARIRWRAKPTAGGDQAGGRSGRLTTRWLI